MNEPSQDPGLGPGLQRSSADTHTLTPAPENRSSEFVAVSGADEETTSATTMLVSAYVLFWLLLLGFVWTTWRRQQRLADRLKIIEARLASPNTGDPK
jgi:hypothetical protein